MTLSVRRKVRLAFQNKAHEDPTHLSTRAISPTPAHFFLNAVLVSLFSLSLTLSTPNFSLALAFQILTLPSSLPETTNLASSVKVEEKTRCMRLV